jgi:hypothetical protein
MKPSSLTKRDARKLPLVDYHYQAPTLSGSTTAGCVGVSKSLRAISRDYFDGETNREFLGEAAVFVTLIAMTLVPIVSGAFAVIELCRTLPLF